MMTTSGKVFREVEQNCWCIDTRLAEMDAGGIDVQVLSTVPVMFNYAINDEHALHIARFLNDHLADCVKRAPERFVALGSVPLQNPTAACTEMLRCRYELGFPGVQIGSHVNDWNLDAKELEPFWEVISLKSRPTFSFHVISTIIDSNEMHRVLPVNRLRRNTHAACSCIRGTCSATAASEITGSLG